MRQVVRRGFGAKCLFGLFGVLFWLITINPCHAAQFTINTDIYDGSIYTSSYFGDNPSYGDVSDGGYDAFDGFGEIDQLGDLTLYRQVEAFTGMNFYRWLDTFTNNTSGPITQTVRFWGNLGSDGNETIELINNYYIVSHDGSSLRDPVLAFVNGNNAWAAANIDASVIPNYYEQFIDLTLAPGESVSILNFVFLAREDGSYDAVLRGQDIDLAIATGQDLVDNPYLTGLSEGQINNIVNFDVSAQPIPTINEWGMIIFTLLLGFSAVWYMRRSAVA